MVTKFLLNFEPSFLLRLRSWRWCAVLFFSLIAFNGYAQNEFITVWEPTSSSLEVTIPTKGTGYNYAVDWGDGNIDTGQAADASHTYAASGSYTVKIIGDFPRIYFAGSTTTNSGLLSSVKQWGANVWQSMEGAFEGATNMTVLATDSPNLSQVQSMASMFANCDALDREDFTSWNISNAASLQKIFYQADNFNGDISTWDTGNVTDMSQAFDQAVKFNRELKRWNTSKVTTMVRMFAGISGRTTSFNNVITDWDVSSVTNMDEMFERNERFNHEIEIWDVSQVTSMSNMFSYATSFDNDLGDWDVSGVQSMDNMFLGANRFDKDISAWDVSSIKSMENMFSLASEFNQDISNWNVSAVITMQNTFNGAAAFDQNLALWNISQVTNMSGMLDDSGMSQFNYDFTLEGWEAQTVQNDVTLGANGLEYCTSLDERQSLIDGNAWTISDDAQGCNTTVTIAETRANEEGGAFVVTLTSDGFILNGFTVEVSTADGSATAGTDYTALADQTITFVGTAGETQTFTIIPTADTEVESDETLTVNMSNAVSTEALNTMNITDQATITIIDDETQTSLFITTWETTEANQEIVIPTEGSGYDYQVDWGDGTIEINQTGNASHSYASAGDHQVKIIGSFPRIYLAGGTADNSKRLKSIDQWGTNSWQSMEGAFSGAENMVLHDTESPNLSGVISMKEMFKSCKLLNQTIGSWNVYSVIDKEGLFEDAEIFNQNISDWNMRNTANMSRMFAGAKAFNQPIENWSTSEITDMSGMFSGAEAFNRDISGWEVDNVSDMSEMFNGAIAFNQNISDWNVSSVTDMSSMFSGASAFSSDLSIWNVSSVTNMASIFRNAEAFNQELSDWDVSLVENMNAMFKGAAVFNQNLSAWTATSVTTMEEMFADADSFNQDVSGWDMSSVSVLKGMFAQNDAFNQNLGAWDIIGATDLTDMFDLSAMNSTNYDATLKGWADKAVPNGLTLGVEGLKYCSSTIERQSLIDTDGWSFDGDAAGCESILTIAETGGNEDDGDIIVTLTLNTEIIDGFTVDVSTTDGTAIAGTDYTSITAQTITFAGTARETQSFIVTSMADNDDEGDENFVVNMSNVVSANLLSSLDITDEATVTIVNDDNDAAFFIATWETMVANEEIIIPAEGEGYNYRVDWGDGTIETNQMEDASHTYTTPGIQTVKIIGAFPRIFFSEQDEDGDDLGLKFRSVEQWGSNKWQSMEGAFEGASNMVINATDAPDLSQVVRMDQMFSDCHALTNEDFTNWDVSNVQNMEELFIRTDNFNGDISNWNTAQVTNMEKMFQNALSFQGDLSGWNVASVENMKDLFGLSESAVTANESMLFNGDITNWQVSNVTNFHGMFFHNTVFNQPIGDWDVSSALEMEEMFQGASVFNQSLNNWDVSQVTDMQDMFDNATAFDQPLDLWQTGAVTTMNDMFKGATAFNQDLSSWNVSSVTAMAEMFEDATAFDQNIASWDITQVTDMEEMLDNSGMSVANYDGLLVGWAAQNVQSGVLLGAEGLKFCGSDTERQSLITNHGWTINGDDEGCIATVTIADTSGNEDDGNMVVILELDANVAGGFIVDVSTAGGTAIAGTDYSAITSQTISFSGTAGERIFFNVPMIADGDNESDETFIVTMSNLVTGADNSVTISDEATATIINDDDPSVFFTYTWETRGATHQVRVPTEGTGYNYRVDWGDGTIETNQIGDAVHTYATAGTYTVKILGAFPRIYVNTVSNNSPIKTIEQWGNNPWQSMESAFKGLDEISINTTDAPDLSNATSMAEMFADTDIGSPDFTGWDVSSIEDMTGLFLSSNFNGDVSNWDVSSVINMSTMFSGAESFNGDISGWDVSSVTNMRGMFANASVFNIDISGWDMSNVTTIRSMFQSTEAFNQDLSSWDVSKVTSMIATFSRAATFNQPLDSWDVSNVTSFEKMFDGTDAFNQDLNSWDVSSSASFDQMFYNSKVFNSDISNWDTSSGENFDGMFEGSEAFNSPIGDWDLSNATLIKRMFREAEVFNQPINNWRFPKVMELDEMFRRAEAFNQDLNDWEIDNIISLKSTFEEATAFNGQVSNWDVSNVVNFTDLFDETSFNQDLSDWDVGNGESFGRMFNALTEFNQDLSEWDMSKAKKLGSMFRNSAKFDQDLSNWQISSVTEYGSIFQNTGLSVANYDAILISWAQQDVVTNREFNVEDLAYCAGNDARQSLIDKGWQIENDIQSCSTEVTIADVSANEDDGDITVTLTSEAFVIGGFTLDVNTADGTATVGTDYTGVTAKTISFDGTVGETQTFTITPTADSDVEEDETIIVSMSESIINSGSIPTSVPLVPAVITKTDQATITILNDDNAAPVVTDIAVSGIAQEGQTLTGSYTYSDTENDPEDGTVFQWYIGSEPADAQINSGVTLEDHEFQVLANRPEQQAFYNILDNAVYTEDFINNSTDPISQNVDIAFGIGIGFGMYPISAYDQDANSLDGFTTKNATSLAITSLSSADLSGIVTGADINDLIAAQNLTLTASRVDLAGAPNFGVGAVVAFELVDTRGSIPGLIEIVSVDFSGQSAEIKVYLGTAENENPNTAITGATTTELTLTSDLVGESLIFGVTPANAEGTGEEVLSDAVGPIERLPVAAFTTASASNDESAASATIEVALDQAGLVATTIDYAVTGTATAANDYTLASGTLTFAAGDVSETIDLAIIDDAIVELDETVVITLSNPTEATLGTNTEFVYTITDNDQANVRWASINGKENGGPITLTVTLDRAVEGGFSVDLITAESTAQKGVDYTGLEDVTLTFTGTVGEMQSVIITPIDDEIIEFDEEISVLFDNVSNSDLEIDFDDVIFVTIENDDQATVTISDVSQFEDGESFLVTATLDKQVVNGFTVDIATADGSATAADEDYTAVIGKTLTFVGTSGETQTFEVSPGADSKLEANETFSVSMSNLVATTLPVIISDQATLTITNDDAASITIADASGNEGDGAITVTATLSNAVQGGFTVDLSTADGTATIVDNDYTAMAGETLSFTGTIGETQTFSITPVNDLIIESDETVTISMSNLSTSLGVDVTDGATVTLINDDFNNFPTDIMLSVSSIAENNALDAVLGALSTTDADVANTHAYSLISGTGDDDNGNFIIDGADLRVNNMSFNFEDRSSYSIRLQTDDGEGGTFAKAFIITITNVNEQPFTLSLTNSTIDEADEAQTVGSFMTLDPDNGDSFTYALITGAGDTDNAAFQISGSTLNTAGLVNFEVGATRCILVQVTDAGGLTFDQQFTITIEEVVLEPLREFTTNTPGADVKNVFSPNGDGVNETWVIEDILDNPVNEVKVFAQGGKLIYSKVNYRNDWDGTFKDDPVPDGTYYYEINIYNGDRIIKGFLTIIRNR